jgi:hypothetical protein
MKEAPGPSLRSVLTIATWSNNQEDTILYFKSDLGEVGWGSIDLIGLAQDRNKLRAAVINFLVLLNTGWFLSVCITGAT